MIAGNGVRISNAYDELTAVAEALATPVATTAGGKGTFAETHALALGTCGNFGTSLANAVVGAADVVLVVGSKLAPTDTAFETTKLLDPKRQTIIQIEIEPKNASWTYPVEVPLIGDAKVVLAQLTEAVQSVGGVSAAKKEMTRANLQTARAHTDSSTRPSLFPMPRLSYPRE